MTTLLSEERADAVALNERFIEWAAMARARRHCSIGEVWWVHAAAAAALSAWYDAARHWRVLGAASRESLWIAARDMLARWRVRGEMRRMACTLDDPRVTRLTQSSSAMRKWRAHSTERSRGDRILRLGRLAFVASQTQRCLHRWAEQCTDPGTRRVRVADSSELVLATAAVAWRHCRHSALGVALSDWRLGAMQRHIYALDMSRAWHPTARRVLLVWRADAIGLSWRRRVSAQRALGSAQLAMALALRAWRAMVARVPEQRLKDERARIGVAVIALDRWRRRAAALASEGGRAASFAFPASAAVSAHGLHRRSRGGRQRWRLIASAGAYALIAAERKAWHCLQLRRVEQSLWRYALAHWVDRQMGMALDLWMCYTSAAAIAGRMRALGSSMAAMNATRRGFDGIGAAATAREALTSVAKVAFHAGKRRAAEAIYTWRSRCGRTPKQMYVEVRRCYELARALLLLYVWRDWTAEVAAQRASELLSETLPLVHALRRWRGCAEHKTAATRLHANIDLLPRARRLPPAWRAWQAIVIERHCTSEMLDMSLVGAERGALKRGLWLLGEGARSRSSLTSKRLWFRATHAAAGALRRWRHLPFVSRPVGLTAGRLHRLPRWSVMTDVTWSQRARAFRHWAKWRIDQRRTNLRGFRADAAGTASMLRGGFAALSAAAEESVNAQRADRLLRQRRGCTALTRWCAEALFERTRSCGDAAWRRRAVLAAIGRWEAVATAIPLSVRWDGNAARVDLLRYRRRCSVLRDALCRLSNGCQASSRQENSAVLAAAAAKRLSLRRGTDRLRVSAQRRATRLFLCSLGGSEVNGSGVLPRGEASRGEASRGGSTASPLCSSIPWSASCYHARTASTSAAASPPPSASVASPPTSMPPPTTMPPPTSRPSPTSMPPPTSIPPPASAVPPPSARSAAQLAWLHDASQRAATAQTHTLSSGRPLPLGKPLGEATSSPPPRPSTYHCSSVYHPRGEPALRASSSVGYFGGVRTSKQDVDNTAFASSSSNVPPYRRPPITLLGTPGTAAPPPRVRRDSADLLGRARGASSTTGVSPSPAWLSKVWAKAV